MKQTSRGCIYFNSQPHKEADNGYRRIYVNDYISTHSLTRRLTKCLFTTVLRLVYFNSQPHKEADDWNY